MRRYPQKVSAFAGVATSRMGSCEPHAMRQCPLAKNALSPFGHSSCSRPRHGTHEALRAAVRPDCSHEQSATTSGFCQAPSAHSIRRMPGPFSWVENEIFFQATSGAQDVTRAYALRLDRPVRVPGGSARTTEIKAFHSREVVLAGTPPTIGHAWADSGNPDRRGALLHRLAPKPKVLPESLWDKPTLREALPTRPRLPLHLVWQADTRLSA